MVVRATRGHGFDSPVPLGGPRLGALRGRFPGPPSKHLYQPRGNTMRKAVLLLILLAPFTQADAAPKLETLFCNAGYDTCVSSETRRVWVEARARLLLGCSSGYESGCSAQPGQTYETHVHVNGTTVMHNCENKHYIHQIGIVSLVDPFTGATGVNFIVSAGTQQHCSQPSCNAGCGSAGGCSGLQ